MLAILPYERTVIEQERSVHGLCGIFKLGVRSTIPDKQKRHQAGKSSLFAKTYKLMFTSPTRVYVYVINQTKDKSHFQGCLQLICTLPSKSNAVDCIILWQTHSLNLLAVTKWLFGGKITMHNLTYSHVIAIGLAWALLLFFRFNGNDSAVFNNVLSHA
ncbi:hypothetical protein P5673_016266 [Acropora cervicornis]|uniref:Uncharacterized protein n=1 Tax=Acropora cervicornis TaxID=6130 RepID=A0AAD9V561_ACRCE|nr:hypothetical protein P5673_016266 [Acropora cervicornis]